MFDSAMENVIQNAIGEQNEKNLPRMAVNLIGN